MEKQSQLSTAIHSATMQTILPPGGGRMEDEQNGGNTDDSHCSSEGEVIVNLHLEALFDLITSRIPSLD